MAPGEAAAGRSALERGRDAFARAAWGDAHAQLSAADRAGLLAPEDVERLAAAAYLTGRDAESAELLGRAHHEFLGRGDAARAARCAFWLAFGLFSKGEHAQGGGWIARAQRLLDDGGLDCVERGYLLVPVALRTIGQGDNEAALATFGRAAEIGSRFGDRDLVVLARHGQGRALIRLGRTAEGVALLDEIMVAVTAGEVSPIVAGDVYCSVIEGCHEMFDLRRAQEWTGALGRWCESQPDLVPYRGQCLVRRAELLQLHGAWPDAMDEAQRARERLSQPPPGQRAVGAALYQEAELHRLRGEFAAAEQGYRAASVWGRTAHPGLSQLRLAQGRAAAAVAAIRGALDDAPERRTRARLLGPAVEIMVAAGEVAGARDAADELAAIAADLGAPLLDALSAHATGLVLLAEGEPRAALATLRHAHRTWDGLAAPYEAARVRLAIAQACRELGDADTADLELDAARAAFRRLGAAPDLAPLEPAPASRGAAAELTAREAEVLKLVATGKTNRAIAADLHISEKTIARHVSNIFSKLDVASRAAATAFAYQHGLA